MRPNCQSPRCVISRPPRQTRPRDCFVAAFLAMARTISLTCPGHAGGARWRTGILRWDHEAMSKAFVKETDDHEDDLPADDAPAIPAGVKNYMTPEGHRRLQEELRHLLRDERPRVVEIVSWAAGNGDRSENGDYLYGKKRLREIDRRIRFLTKRLERAEIREPARQ